MATHTPGQLPLDFEAIGVDFYEDNCHKWMLSPKGSGFLYARPEVQPLLELLVVSWEYHATPQNAYVTTFLDYLSWNGTNDSTAYSTVLTTNRFMKNPLGLSA